MKKHSHLELYRLDNKIIALLGANMLAHLEVGVIRRKIVNRYMTSYNLLGNFVKITDTSLVYNGQL